MGIKTNIIKAHNYMKKNGLKKTIAASLERLQGEFDSYNFSEISEDEYKRQSEAKFEHRTQFSIVVPMYETNEVFAKEMIDSVLNQSYPNLELILADASKTSKVEDTVRKYTDGRIVYLKLTENNGISENTNAGIAVASGQYIGLLDHDDVLTLDALYEMARYIEKGKKEGIEYSFVYSDEDKCDSFATKYYEPNRKPDFNLDLLLSNNYICHFTVMEAELMKRLKLRKEFDGAQDHDLVLRASYQADATIGHVSKVLYHWRCHEDSTAANPQSKLYAYEAGKRAVQAYMQNRNVDCAVVDTDHNGFFRVEYGALKGTTGEINGVSDEPDIADIFKNRFDVGVIGGPLVKYGKITGGIIDASKTCTYEGNLASFSGYMHRQAMQQDSYAVDIRNMYIRTELLQVVKEVFRKPEYYNLLKQDLTNTTEKHIYLGDMLNTEGYDDLQILDVSCLICEKAALEGYLVFYDPKAVRKL